ncbi:MAG: pyridoxal phosphate-dependent aminotransferase [Candidatus Thorarchaeota archaeon]|jgi:aminotransferase
MRFRTDRIMHPPILKLIEAAQRYVASPDFLNLGQGLPGHIPPTDALKAFGDTLLHPATHRYTPDQGHLELREELAIYLRQNWSIAADPEKEISITAGANAAFTGTIFTILAPGDRVIMPSPYYFNSVMAVRLAGGEITEVPVDSDFQLNYEAIESAVDKDTRAIYITSPNNPTGAVYSRETVDALVDLCIDNDLLLISDETFGRLIFEGANHYSPQSRSDARDRVISLGSFSKDFGMSGWRVGYVIGSDDFMQEFLKVQDTVTICAPTPGQMLALEILKHGLDQIQEELDKLSLLRDLAYLRISEIQSLETTRTPATFYMFPRVNNCPDSRKLVLDILRDTKLLVLPGSIFGEAGESHLRISIGPLTPEAVDEAFDRLSGYFRNH